MFTWTFNQTQLPPDTNFRLFIYIYIYNQGGGSQGNFYLASTLGPIATGAAKDPPRISWTSAFGSVNPAQVQAGQTYTISADAQDDNGNLAAVSINKNGQPFAYAGGGNGYSGNSQNPTSDPAGAVTYTAWAGRCLWRSDRRDHLDGHRSRERQIRPRPVPANVPACPAVPGRSRAGRHRRRSGTGEMAICGRARLHPIGPVAATPTPAPNSPRAISWSANWTPPGLRPPTPSAGRAGWRRQLQSLRVLRSAYTLTVTTRASRRPRQRHVAPVSVARGPRRSAAAAGPPMRKAAPRFPRCKSRSTAWRQCAKPSRRPSAAPGRTSKPPISAAATGHPADLTRSGWSFSAWPSLASAREPAGPHPDRDRLRRDMLTAFPPPSARSILP